MSWELDKKVLTTNDSWVKEGVSSYQKAEGKFIISSEWVDDKIEQIKWLVKNIIDPKQKRIFNKAIKDLEKQRREEFEAVSQMNISLLSDKNDEYLNFLKMVKSANIWMWFADNISKKFIVLNKTFCKILEVSEEECMWIDYPSFWDKFVVDKKAFENLKKQFEENWEVSWWILPIKTRKWKNKWIRIYSTATEWDKEIITIFDITEREKERLSHKKAIHVLQHDIRWPLGAAEGLLLDNFWESCALKLNDYEKGVVNEIIKVLRRIRNTADSYLDFSRMEKWTFKPRYSEINIIDAVKEACKSVENSLHRYDKFIFVDVDWNIVDYNNPILFEWDSNYIYLLLFNLLKNAAEEPFELSKVKIRIVEDKESVILIVNNTNTMPEEIKNNIFRKKFVDSDKQNWNGIWTYSMKLIVDVHWWVIDFTSIDKKGTTMYIKLPKKAKIINTEETK